MGMRCGKQCSLHVVGIGGLFRPAGAVGKGIIAQPLHVFGESFKCRDVLFICSLIDHIVYLINMHLTEVVLGYHKILTSQY